MNHVHRIGEKPGPRTRVHDTNTNRRGTIFVHSERARVHDVSREERTGRNRKTALGNRRFAVPNTRLNG